MRTRLSCLMGLWFAACGTDVGELTEEDPILDENASEFTVDDDDGEPDGEGGTTPPSACPAFPPAAVLVSVQASADTAVCDAVVEIRDGDFVRIAQRGGLPEACVYFSVFERAGTYLVSVTHADFAPLSVSGVVVELDACGHAVTTAIEVDLAPGGGPVDDDVEPDPVVDEPDTDPGVEPEDPVTDPEPTFVCPPDEAAHVGDVVLSSPDSISVLNGIACVAGHVTVEGALETLSLPVLRRVMGDLLIAGAPALATLTLPTLSDVGGDVVVRGTALVELDGLDALRVIGGTISIENNPALEIADLAITDAGALALVDNGSLVRARLRTLDAVSAITVSGNPELDDMDLRAVSSVTGDVVLEGAVFGDLDLRLLTSVSGDFVLADASDIDAFDQMADLSSVGGDLTIRDLPSAVADDAATFVAGITVAGTTLVCGLDGGDPCP